MFSVQLARLDNKDYLNLTTAKKRRRIKSALCAISGEKLDKKYLLTALVFKPVALSVESINIGYRIVENLLVKDKNKTLT